MSDLRELLSRFSDRAVLPRQAFEGVQLRRDRRRRNRRIATGIVGLSACLIGVYALVLASPWAERGDAGAESCANRIIFDGSEYLGRAAIVLPVPGDIIGVADVPGCPDEGEGRPSVDEHIEVASVMDIDPAIALVAADDPSTIFIREGMGRLPAELTAFFEPPLCRSSDAPIALDGTWLGILSPDGTTELDMVPPYNIEMLVERSTVKRYERANLTILVPASLGKPLTREDVRMSLRQGREIRILASCEGGRFVAESVEATLDL